MQAVTVIFAIAGCLAAEPSKSDKFKLPTESMRAAIERAIPLLEQGSKESADKRTCFTCHNQAIPVFALMEARRRGFTVDEDNLKRQLDHTAAHLARGREDYLKGKGQGGRAHTAGYALWTLEEGGRGPDETTAAVTAYLLDHQKEAWHWSHPSRRPPSSGSDFATTYLALRALEVYGTPEQAEAISERQQQVLQWLTENEPRDNEDRVFRLWSLVSLDADQAVTKKALDDLLQTQRDDGGWGQNEQLDSDAYATGTALAVLLQAGGLTADDPAIQRAIEFLLNTQQPDGSWYVATRAEGFQVYYESGFPHGKDQFISIAASAWSTWSLLLALPEGDAADVVIGK